MGLLDMFTQTGDPDRNRALAQGLLTAGFAAMAGRGNTMQALGQGGLAGLVGYGNELQRQEQSKFAEAQQKRAGLHDQMTQIQLDEALRRQRINGLAPQFTRSPEQLALSGGGGPTVANAAKIGDKPGFDMQAYLAAVEREDPLMAMEMRQKLGPKPSDFKTVGGSLVQITPDGKVSEAYRAPKDAPAEPEALRALKLIHGEGSPQYLQAARQYADKLVTPSKGVSLNVDARNINTQESEQSKAYGKGLGAMRTDISNSAFRAPSTMAKLNRIEELLSGVDGGKLAPVGLEVASAAESLGLKIDPKLGNKQAAEALARELASALREPGTGPMTDKDFENFLQQVPNLSKTAEGRAQIIATSRAKLARDIEIGKLAREYARKNGGVIDDGFLDVVSDYVAQNPVVQRESTSGRTGGFPDVSAIDAELNRRGGR